MSEGKKRTGGRGTWSAVVIAGVGRKDGMKGLVPLITRIKPHRNACVVCGECVFMCICVSVCGV